jgi:membrane-associated HD superfamily phosphohydrolase
METTTAAVELLFERTEDYTKTTFELAKLKALSTTTDIVTSVTSRISVIIMASLFVLVFNVGVALLLGDLLGKSYYGFFIVAAFYLLATLIAHFFLHQWIKKPVSTLIITQALQSEMSWKK